MKLRPKRNQETEFEELPPEEPQEPLYQDEQPQVAREIAKAIKTVIL